jgi:predicted transcriptional regulator
MENITFGERLKKIRVDNNVSQNELAKYLEITPSSLSYYENGVRTPPITIINKLVNCFNVSANWLLGIENPENKKIKTYADMLAALVPILELENIWNMSINKATFKEYVDCVNDPEEREMIYTMANSAGTPYNKNDTYSIGVLKTVNSAIIGFFEDFQKVYSLYENGSMPESLYKLWIEDRILKFKDIPLPGTDPDEQ